MKLSERVTRPRGFCLDGALFIGYYFINRLTVRLKLDLRLRLALVKSTDPQRSQCLCCLL